MKKDGLNWMVVLASVLGAASAFACGEGATDLMKPDDLEEASLNPPTVTQPQGAQSGVVTDATEPAVQPTTR